MSKHSKTYSKRGASTPVASIQFDKVITDNNKRPSASKSAGVVGKWGTTSFTSLRSSQLNGSKAAKRGLSPVKCMPGDYGFSSTTASSISSGIDAFNFESGVNSGSVANCPTQPKPRKFFKSRATEDTSKNASSVQNPSSHSYVDFPMITSDNITSNIHAAASVGYLSPSSKTLMNKTPPKRGRGRPRGSRNTSPRSSAVNTYKPAAVNPGRGAPRGRRRSKGNRTIRGQQASGRGKRRRAEWEQSESEEEDAASSDGEDQEVQLPSHAEVEEEEEEEEEDEELSNKNGSEHCVEEEEENKPEEEHKPPIKLRIIRQNDTNAFVSKVGTGSVHSNSDSNSPMADEVCETVLPTPSNELVSLQSEKHEEVTAKVISEDTEENDSHHIPCVQQEEKFDSQPVIEDDVPMPPAEPVINLDTAGPKVEMQQKKSSIFKSRFTATQAGSSSTLAKEAPATSKGKKGLALYRHKWHEDDRKAVSGSSDTGNGSAAAPTSAANSSEMQQHAQSFSWDESGGETEGAVSKSIRSGSSSASSSAPTKTAHSIKEEEVDEEMSEDHSGGLRCARKVKDYYTVVRNVKKAHQIQESGEFQEFNDDVDYILDALQDRNPTATRCLSAMSLASKCMEPAFRMHLRAHSTVAKFFQALKDAPSKASVALCTSCIMFVLTQDRLNMDLDRDSLELMLNLLEIDTGQVDAHEGKELEKNKLKVRELCEEMVRKGHAPHLQLDKITAAQLSMETLLSLTSKKAGEWFKEELRVLGGLDHIIQTVTACTTILTSSNDGILNWNWDKTRLDALKKVDRCLRVLENVTFQNEENQNYLMEYSNGRLVDSTLKLLQMLSRELAAYSPPITKDSLGNLLSESLSNLMKVVMNLTHDSNDDSIGSRVYGDKLLTWEVTFMCLLQTSLCLPEEKNFDIMTLALGILINLVERSSMNRDRLMEASVPGRTEDVFDSKPSAIVALINLFVSKEESARLEEARTDEILDGKPPGQSDVPPASTGSKEISTSATTGKTQEDAMEETVKKLLHKAGRHMEDSMVAAYVSLLLGYVVMKNQDYERRVKQLLPENKFTLMIVVLKKFYEFLKLTANAVTSTRGLKNTQLVIKFMENSDRMASSS